MANSRKMQSDIDRLLKKTNEGLEAYEQLYDKFESVANASTKERLEGDLKKEIKKLQRHREQIKAFIATPEVKDTKSLEWYRKRIEEKMEAFKVCEREMKTKAFSKEGLASAANEWNDTPLAQTEAWLKVSIEEGRKKIEILEYEVQKSITARGGRKSKQKSDAMIRLEKLQIHFYKWETLLRMVNNEEVDPEEVDKLRDHADVVLDDETELSVLGDFDIYASFDIPEPKIRSFPLDDDSSEEKKQPPLPKVTSAASDRSPITGAFKTPLSPPSGGNSASGTSAPGSALGKEAPRPKQQSKLTVSTSESAAANVSATPTGTASGRDAPPSHMWGNASMAEDDVARELLEDDMDALNDDTFGDDAMTGGGGVSLSDMANATSKLTMKIDNEWEKRKLDVLKKAKPPASDVPGPTVPTMDTGTSAAGTQPKDTLGSGTGNAPTPGATEWDKRRIDALRAKSLASSAGSAEQPSQSKKSISTSIPPAPSSQTHQSSVATTGPAERPHSKYTPSSVHTLLDMSLGNLPHTLDVERQRPYEPPNAIDALPHFPQEVHPVLSCRDIYREFDLETLLFIFYYHQKSYQQYFAAKELKARSFRYHTELRQWYQRREKPRATTATSERGAFTYFDYEDAWQKKTVDDFTFNYEFLEDELV